MKNKIEEYRDCEFRIEIKKERGRLNSLQTYEFSNPLELLTGIASMTEQLIRKGIADENEIKMAVEMGVRRSEWKSLDL